MIHLFTGENDFALKAALIHRTHTFRDEHGLDAVVVREGETLTVADLPQLLSGLTLFSPQQLVIVSDLSLNKTIWEQLPERLETAESDLILVEAKPDKRTRTYKWLQKNATIHNHTFPPEHELKQWVTTVANQEGINIAPDISSFLVSYVGTDQWRLSQEIKKLSLANKPITQELIRDIVDPNPQASVFELLDAAIAGDVDRVVSLISIIERTEDPYKFVGLITSQVYALAVVHAGGDRPSAAIAKDAGIHPFVASKTQTVARRIPRERLAGIIEQIGDLDMQLKSTGGDPWLLIRAALTKIAAS